MEVEVSQNPSYLANKIGGAQLIMYKYKARLR